MKIPLIIMKICQNVYILCCRKIYLTLVHLTNYIGMHINTQDTLEKIWQREGGRNQSNNYSRMFEKKFLRCLILILSFCFTKKKKLLWGISSLSRRLFKYFSISTIFFKSLLWYIHLTYIPSSSFFCGSHNITIDPE